MARNLRLTSLNGSGAADSADTVVIDGKEVRDFDLDFTHAQISEASHRLGPLGKRIEIKGISKSRPEIEKTISIECYDNFPSLALTTAAYKNDRHDACKV